MARNAKCIRGKGEAAAPVHPDDPAVKMILALQRVFASADEHGEQTFEPDHAVGDLQDFARHLAKHAGPEVTLRAVETWFTEEVEEWVGASKRGRRGG